MFLLKITVVSVLGYFFSSYEPLSIEMQIIAMGEELHQ